MLKKYNQFITETKIITLEKPVVEESILNPNFSIVVPGGCNGNCAFCFWHHEKPCANYIQQLKETMQQLPPQFYQLSLTGGEPTLSPYLESILEVIDPRQFTHTVLTSNGAKLEAWVDKLAGKIQHINISRHHFSDEINEQLFKTDTVPSSAQLKELCSRYEQVGIDITFSAVLSEHLSTPEDILAYVEFAKQCGAAGVFFRKPHGSLEPSAVEQQFERYKCEEAGCPVCRTKKQRINGLPVAWKASLAEPSTELGTIYETIFHANGTLTKDWEAKLIVEKIKTQRNHSEYHHLNEGCGSSSSSSGYIGCGSISNVESISPKKRELLHKIGKAVIANADEGYMPLTMEDNPTKKGITGIEAIQFDPDQFDPDADPEDHEFELVYRKKKRVEIQELSDLTVKYLEKIWAAISAQYGHYTEGSEMGFFITEK